MTATTTGPTLALGLDPSGIERGADVAKNALNGLGGAAKKASGDVTTASRALVSVKDIALGTLAGFGTGFGIQALSRLPAMFVKIADEITAMESRLRLATSSVSEFRTAYAAISDIANSVGTSVTAIGDLYSKLSMAATDLGASQKELEVFTRAVAHALAVSGTSAAAAQGALLQLSQAVGSGTVRAEEFNSVLEGAPRLARAAADGFDGVGLSVAELRKRIAAGEVTSRQFFEAVNSQSNVLQKEMDQTADTVGRAGAAMANAIGALIDKLNDATGVTRTLASAMRGIADATHAVINLSSDDAQVKLKQLEKSLEEVRKPWTVLGYEIPWKPGAQTTAEDSLKKLIEQTRPLAEQQRSQADADQYAKQLRDQAAANMIKPPKPRYEDEAAAAREDRDARLASASRRAISDGESAANKAEAAARRLLSAQREIAQNQAKMLEDTGRYADAIRLRADTDVAAWREQARAAGLSADETQKGIDTIRATAERSIADRLSVGQRMLAELSAAEWMLTGRVEDAAAARTKIAIDEWRERARAAGLAVDQIVEGERSITATAHAEAAARARSIDATLNQMEAVELEKTGKSKEAIALRRQMDVDAWKEQANQAGMTADKTARGVKLIEAQYERAAQTGTKFFDAMGSAAEAVATRIGDEFTSMFMTIVQGGKLTAKQVTDTFAKITISTLMQTMSRWAINSISSEMQIGKAFSAGLGSLASMLGFAAPGQTVTGAEGQTHIGHGGGDTLAARGGAFSGGNVIPFATGGALVNERTRFPMRNGYGVMGEAGPEGIFPLTRTSGGDLGIKAERPSISVKINNYGDANVRARESDGGLTIDIDSIVADVVARRGSRTNRAIRGMR